MDQANQYIKQTHNKFGIKLDVKTLKLESFIPEKNARNYGTLCQIAGKRQQQNERLK